MTVVRLVSKHPPFDKFGRITTLFAADLQGEHRHRMDKDHASYSGRCRLSVLDPKPAMV